MDDQLTPEEYYLNRVRRIVITGGPCSGKTTALEYLREGLSDKGWRVIFVPEVAGELILGGVAPWTCKSYDNFQHAVFEMQLAKERAFNNALKEMDPQDTVIVHDRGIMDNGGYMTPEGFEKIMNFHGFTTNTGFARYDAVFHLRSTATDLVEAYTLDNNSARMETPEEAAAVDARLEKAWSGHPHLFVIGNEPRFEDKMEKLVSSVLAFLED